MTQLTRSQCYITFVGVAGCLLAATTALSGCGGDPGDGSSDLSKESLIEHCSGAYQCSGDGERFETELSKYDGDCYAGELLLAKSGSETAGDVTISWSGNAEEWDLAASIEDDSMTVTCTAVSSAKKSKKSDREAGRCTGSADDCTSFSPPYCETNDGCRMESTLHWDGSWTNECAGIAEICERYTDQRSCENQQGCSWT